MRLLARLFIAFFVFFISVEGVFACSNPDGMRGEVIHSENGNVPSYCDGTNWIAMVGSEEQVLAPVCPPGITSCGGNPNERVVFVSSTGSPNLGGVSGRTHIVKRARRLKA
jgi:hypothetical protein